MTNNGDEMKDEVQFWFWKMMRTIARFFYKEWRVSIEFKGERMYKAHKCIGIMTHEFDPEKQKIVFRDKGHYEIVNK